MKKLITTIGVALLLTGCATNWQDATGKSLATIAQTVDASMKGWEAYSVRAGLPDNDPTELKVKAAYQEYQRAFQTALVAYNAAVTVKDQTILTQATAALTASESNILNLIASLTPSTPK